MQTLPFLDTVKQGLLPNVSFVDPAFDTEGNGTSADDHPLADIRLGERFIADTYHALASADRLAARLRRPLPESARTSAEGKT